MADDCIFCRIARGDIHTTFVAENSDCVAFRDLNPQAPTHILVIPRAHVASLDAANDASLLGKMLLMGAEVARTEGIAAAGYRCVINTNAEAGQTVFHIHLHVLGGRRMKWPPG